MYEFAAYDILGIKRGSTLDVSLEYVAPSPELAVDFTGWTATSQVRRTDSDVQVAIELVVELTGSVIRLRKPAAEIAKVPAGDYVYDIRFVDAAGEVWPTPTARFQVVASVTK